MLVAPEYVAARRNAVITSYQPSMAAAAAPALARAGAPAAPPGPVPQRVQRSYGGTAPPPAAPQAPPQAAPAPAPRREAAPAPAPRREAGGRPLVDESNAVVAFLRQEGLQMYAAALLQSGFDDLETLVAIEDADMKDLGIPSYHIVRLRRKIQELQRRSAGDDDEPSPDHPVVAFLAEVGLSQYSRALLKSGFDEMDTLLLIDDLDLKELGVARGHALKLKKRLREYELERDAQEAAPTLLARAPQRRQPEKSQRVPAPRGPGGAARAPAAAAVAAGNILSDQGRSAVEQSWEQVQVHGAYAVGELLYRHTFTLAPEAIGLFPPEVRQKYRDWGADEGSDEEDVWESAALRKLFGKVVNAVGCTVAGLHDMGKLVPMLTKLGMRHINYGVSEAHWQVLAQALDMTLRDILGEAYTHEVQQAWTMVYGFMSSIMIEGLRLAIKERDSVAELRPSTSTRSEVSGRDISDISSQCSSIVVAQDADPAIGEDGAFTGEVQVSQVVQNVTAGSLN